jgi:hypothetical protein
MSTDEKGGGNVKKFLLAILVLLIIAGVVCAFVFPEKVKGLVSGAPAGNRAHSKEVGASLGIPTGWKSQIRSVGTPALIVENASGDAVSVTFQRVPADTKLEEFARGKLKAGSGAGYQEQESSAGTLAGIVGWMLVATHGQGESRRTSLVYVLPRGDRIYTVRCSAKPRRFGAQRKTLQSAAAGLKLEAPAEK